MKRMKMESIDMVQKNIERIGELFPNVITEMEGDDGRLKKGINFELLKQELQDYVVDGEEHYEFTWVGKKSAIVESNMKIRKTLRPCIEESKDWETTQNLYIEGDNLEVLKLLQESYLNSIKMIYIDPPYNTGNDFIYRDNYRIDKNDYEDQIGLFDEEENRLFKNTETNGRFHSDWCSMMYPRLKLAYNLLSEDGVIFISIDDNEVDNLKKMCNEVFGEENFIGIITWSKKRKGSFLSKRIISLTEYLLVYTKNKASEVYLFGGKANNAESQPIIKRTNSITQLNIKPGLVSTKLNDGIYKKGIYGDDINPVELIDDVIFKDGINVNAFRIKAPFVWSQQFLNKEIEKGTKLVINTINFQIRAYRVYDKENFKGYPSLINGVSIKGTNEDAYEELWEIFQIKRIFDYSKPVCFLKELINTSTYFQKEAIILDFFSGSATTAHAVMQLNTEDGGNRKFIMVQLPEECDEKSEAYKAGYKNVSEIGKERIRRAGEKIKEDNKDKENIDKLDTGFRVLKVDSTNMKDVYYAANEYNQDMLAKLDSNIKEDRTDMDLLYGVLIDWGLPLSLNHRIEKIENITVHFYDCPVDDGELLTYNCSLAACFEEKVPENVVREIAKRQPLRAVFRDSSFVDSPGKINVEEIFKLLAPNTSVRVI
jgi:adenine-specific DNA-methyltransferase